MSATPIPEKMSSREALFMKLYQQAFPLVAQHVAKMGGSFDEAKDIFQDALVLYYEKVQVSGLALKYSEKSYLLGIAKHLWIKRYHENSRHSSLDLEDHVFKAVIDVADIEYREVAPFKLMRLLEQTGQKCMQLLSAFYYEKLDMDALAGRFGFSGARSATAQKFKCLQKVKETVKEKSLKYEDIVE
ncbi:RNA polymerase sigma factor [Pedobacter miscanthi]|uniref:Sigma-70 family RNA polymerase sigma factor n=1 Tax=Pedobacter miscanthi TaxID=2259170 RepID=A0A366KZJ6_9SPHI|nr:sigma-70 family RNA polymerase sigma factor [Pedobacter miscanthi]RBQ06659.1 sigma-70 family RNA polymerase sigma factor [Pedobacter miscanthi]